MGDIVGSKKRVEEKGYNMQEQKKYDDITIGGNRKEEKKGYNDR